MQKLDEMSLKCSIQCVRSLEKSERNFIAKWGLPGANYERNDFLLAIKSRLCFLKKEKLTGILTQWVMKFPLTFSPTQ